MKKNFDGIVINLQNVVADIMEVPNFVERIHKGDRDIYKELKPKCNIANLATVLNAFEVEGVRIELAYVFPEGYDKDLTDRIAKIYRKFLAMYNLKDTNIWTYTHKQTLFWVYWNKHFLYIDTAETLFEQRCKEEFSKQMEIIHLNPETIVDELLQKYIDFKSNGYEIYAELINTIADEIGEHAFRTWLFKKVIKLNSGFINHLAVYVDIMRMIKSAHCKHFLK